MTIQLTLFLLSILSILCFFGGCKESKKTLEVAPGVEGSISATITSDHNFGETRIDKIPTVTIHLKYAGNGTFKASQISTSKITSRDTFRYIGSTNEYPGEGGDCGTELDLDATSDCTIKLEFAPPTAGSYSQVYTISYNDGINSRSFSFNMKGVAGKQATLISEEGVVDFGIVELGETQKASVSITNVGDLSATDVELSLPDVEGVTYEGGSYPGRTGTCKSTIAPKESCSIVYVAKSSVAKAFTKTVLLTYKDPNFDQSLELTITGEFAHKIPKIRFEDDPTKTLYTAFYSSFGQIAASINNYGYTSAKNLTIQIDPPFSIESTDCGPSLDLGKTCNIMIRFTPTTMNIISQNLIINYLDDFGESHTLSGMIQAKAKDPGRLVVTNTLPINMGMVGVTTSGYQIITLKNEGEETVTNTQAPTLSAPLSLYLDLCSGNPIPKQGTCTFQMKYSPTQVEDLTSDFSVTYFNGIGTTSTNFTVSMQARNIGILEMESHPSGSFSFARILPSFDATSEIFTLRNKGTGTLFNVSSDIISDPFFFVGGSYPGASGDCPAMPFDMVADATCNLHLFYGLDITAPMGQTYTSFTNFYFQDGYKNDLYRFIFYGYTAIDGNLNLAEDYNNGDYLDLLTPDVTLDFGLIPRTVGIPSKKIYAYNSGNYPITDISVDILNNIHYGFKGGSYPGTGGTCGTTLANASSCTFYMSYIPLANGTHDEIFTFSFKRTIGDVSKDYLFTASANDLAFLRFTNISSDAETIYNQKLGTHILGQFKEYTINVENIGSLDATMTDVSFPSSTIYTVEASSDCGSILAVGNNCDVIVGTHNTKTGGDGINNDRFRILYENGMENINLGNDVYADVLAPADIQFNIPGSAIFSKTIVNTASDYSVTINNQGDVTGSSLTFPAPSLPFSISSNTCSSDLGANDSCVVTFRFSPTTINTFQTSYQISYNNGVVATSDDLQLQGESENVLSSHGGWQEIYSTGNVVNVSNSPISDGVLRLKWNDMTPLGVGNIDSYNVYQSTTDGSYDFSTPVATGISTVSKTYQALFSSPSARITPGTTYYYTVRPNINGASSRVSVGNLWQIKVIAPPNNMAYINRMIANQYMCEKMNLPRLSHLNQSCIYTGPGNQNGYYDASTDFLVDMFEMGADGTNRVDQLPQLGTPLDIISAQCLGQSVIITKSSNDTTYSKRLPSRFEQLIYSQYASTDDAAIAILERGSTASLNCNGDGTSIEKTGSNSNCLSKFGVYDVAGNAWEWLNDIEIDDFGVGGALLGVDLGGFETDDYENYTSDCFSHTIGLPTIKTSVCDASKGQLNILTTPPITFREDTYYAPPGTGTFGLIIGGGYDVYPNPGIYTAVWIIPYAPAAGGRCIVPIP